MSKEMMKALGMVTCPMTENQHFLINAKAELKIH